MARAKSGGGLTSNKLKRVPVKYGPSSTNKIVPTGASQLGQMKGDHSTERARASANPLVRLRDGTAVQVDSGNRRAFETPRKPGGGRSIYPAGFQDQHGDVVKGNPAGPGPDILSQFGRESL